MNFIKRYFEWLVCVVVCVAYAFHTAPGVTLEDSGELITAVYSTGIPHQPGYPLFAILAKLFTWIPVGSIAFRVNLFSAVTSGIGLGFIAAGLRRLGERWWPELKNSWPWMSVPAGCLIWTAAAPAYFSQAVITEVYGLNNLLTGVLIYIAILWLEAVSEQDRKQKFFFMFCLMAGLALTNHHTAGAFIPFAGVLMVLIDRKFLSGKIISRGFLFLVAGLLPYVYLPLASMTDPVMDWGNPETWTNFWRVVTRHQYGLDVTTTRSTGMLATQLASPYGCLVEQFTWAGVLLGVWGAIEIWKKDRRWMIALIALHVMTGPLVGYLSNVDLTVADSFVRDEQRALVAVLYLPFYMLWMMGMGIGAASILQRWTQPTARLTVAVAFLMVGVWRFHSTSGLESMRTYRFADRFADNLERLVEPNAIILANWDPFAFPMMYYQQVEGRFSGNVLIDVELMRRSWYLDMMRRWYPDVMERCRVSVDRFLTAVRPFEEGRPFNPHFIQGHYLAMLHDVIAQNPDRPVYATFYAPIRPFERGFAERYRWEPCYAAYRLYTMPDSSFSVDPSRFDFSEFVSDTGGDRMADMLRNYYAIQFAERAMRVTDREAARRHFDEALRLVQSPRLAEEIRRRRAAQP